MSVEFRAAVVNRTFVPLVRTAWLTARDAPVIVFVIWKLARFVAVLALTGFENDTRTVVPDKVPSVSNNTGAVVSGMRVKIAGQLVTLLIQRPRQDYLP